MSKHWLWFFLGSAAVLGYLMLFAAPGHLDLIRRLGFALGFAMPAILIALLGAGVGRLCKRTATGLGVGGAIGVSLLVLLLMGYSYGTAQASSDPDPEGFNDCILNNMTEGASDMAAVEIRRACARQHGVTESGSPLIRGVQIGSPLWEAMQDPRLADKDPELLYEAMLQEPEFRLLPPAQARMAITGAHIPFPRD